MMKRRKSRNPTVIEQCGLATDKLPRRKGSHRYGSSIVALIMTMMLVALSSIASKRERHISSPLRGRRVVAKDQSLEGNDDTDRLDFSGGGNAAKSYRLGDIFIAWLMRWLTFDELLHDYGTRYLNTLAHQYLLETGEAKYVQHNITALLRVMDRKEKTMHYRRAKEDELVVHVRLGDVLTDAEYTDLVLSIKDMWNRKEGFVSKDGNVKFNYNFAEYEELVQRIPQEVAENIQKCVIVGAGHATNEKHRTRNTQYKELLSSYHEETLGCKVSYYGSHNPDKDLMYMASAHWLITGMGGFAQIAAACVTARRGWGHAIYDKFNGEVAGWNDSRLAEREKEMFRSEYINWSSVDTAATMM